MKATDLMIGDLVYIHEPECKGHRIDSIDELDGQVGADGEVYDECDIRPIPLTEEILVKNGFERCDYNNKYFIINDVINLITPKWRGVTEYYACAWYQDEFDDFVQHIEICKCAYIHQLQRLLRLCGMEKELVID